MTMTSPRTQTRTFPSPLLLLLACFFLLLCPSAYAKDASDKAKDAAKSAGDKAKDAAKDAGDKAKDAAKDASSKPKKRGKYVKRIIKSGKLKMIRPGKKKRKLKPTRLELGLLPAVNYDIDRGFGFGVIGTLVKFKPGYYPYRWRLLFLLYATVRPDGAGGVEFPYHDDYVRLDVPGLAGGILRIDARMGFSRFTTVGYFGIGNASGQEENPWTKPAEANPDLALTSRRYRQYDRIYPNAIVTARITMWRKRRKRLELYLGGRFTYNWLNVYKGSKLEKDLNGESGPYARSFLIGTTQHGEFLGNLGVLWDTRNHEQVPTSGFFHEVSGRVGQGIGVPFTYGGVTANLRFFQSIYKEHLVLAIRIIGDMLFGNVPFYELANFGGRDASNGPGGGSSVRGVAAQRYHGKAKLIGNIELRAKIFNFNISTQRFNFGLIAFFDGGRVWSDYFTPTPQVRTDFDGDDFGLKYGVGGGLRIQWGSTFIVRLDLAYSLSDSRFGFYLNIQHIF